ncbi:LolA family protein [Vallicoccus soli]|uniref:DUF2092 domain-containing protein n=1 Tax=Vallicoccus soli TaxID=2339232 RepID=A0A3A3YXB0_9ACTN|nr:DUF2092 domain-containing protein [Vallicoccus soli]RJK96309.1 DUF2092 domain-containing protein [Vallicoccus soli]
MSRTPSRRWAVPAVVAAAVAGAAGAGALPAGAVDLPDLSPADVLVLAQGADVEALSGEVFVEADLGLPELPGGGGGAADPTALLTGDTRLRLWVDGPERQRLQVLRGFSQLDVAHDGATVWTYDSDEDAYRAAELPDRGGDGPRAGERAYEPPAQALTPQELADRALAAVEPSTRVTVGEDLEVAGREAYELRLAPRTDGTLVGQVAVAVDAETGLALRVSVTARGASEPALRVGFTSLDLDRPAAERFRLDPPDGVRVGELAPAPRTADPAPAPRGVPGAGAPRVDVTGEGWAAVLEVDARGALDALDPRQVDALTRRVEGGRVLESDLLGVLLTDDGRVLAGAVPTAALVEAAAR